MIVYHGTTIESLESIQRDGLAPGTYVANSQELAADYAWHRALKLGADGTAILELDVPDPAVEEVDSWWWARGQLVLPAGCPPSCIVSVDDSNVRPFTEEWWDREGDEQSPGD